MTDPVTQQPIELGSPEFWERVKSDPAALAYEVCRVDLTDLRLTLQTHASLRAWVGAVHEQARVEEERAKFELTKRRAIAMMTAKATPDPVSGKAKTVGVMEAEMELDADVAAAQAALFRAMEKRGALRAMVESLTERRDMLVQLSAKQREEEREYGSR